MIGIIAGLAIMIGTELATLAGIEPFASWNTPIAWTGFILFADTIVYRTRGDSWLRSAPREFAMIALLSIPLWIVFEAYNLIIRNWYYTGLPENFWLRQFGYAWAFATIWPAIFEGAELAAIVRAGRAGGAGKARWAGKAGAAERETHGEHGAEDPALSLRPALPVHLAPPFHPALTITIGALMLLAPFFVSDAIARYMAAPIWLGFIFLLDPINARLGAQRLTRDSAINLAASGVLCGLLWEFWNYWARAKWHYAVPIMENVKLFEMPLPGYLGFPAFALECFTMYVFVRAIFAKLGRTIAL